MSSEQGRGTGNTARLLLGVAVVLGLWAMLLGVLAWHHGNGTPAGSASPIRSTPSQWSAALGTVSADERQLILKQLSPAGEALVIFKPTPFDADERPLLTVEIERFPFNYVLMLAWKTASDPRSRFTRLQTPTGARQAYLLSRLDGWRGQVTELALYLYPQPQTSPPIELATPIEFGHFELSADSWSGRLHALVTGWLAPDPWEMISPSSLGVYTDVDEGMPVTPVLFALVALALPVLGLSLNVAGRRQWLRLTCVGLLVAAAVAHLQWVINLAAQTRATAKLVDAVSQEHEAGWQVLYDRDLAALVEAARMQLPAPGTARVMVAADARFFRLRAGWHLRPHNILPAFPGEDVAGSQQVAAGDFLLVYRRPDLLDEAASGSLKLGRRSLPVRVLLQTASGGLLRFEAGS